MMLYTIMIMIIIAIVAIVTIANFTYQFSFRYTCSMIFVSKYV